MFLISITAMLQYILMPGSWGIDMFLIAAVYIVLFSRVSRALFIVWALGMIRSSFSGYDGLVPVYYPLFFLLMYGGVYFIRDRVKVVHPFTQFLLLLIITIPYFFFDFLIHTDVSITRRIFYYWGSILPLALLNGLAGAVSFQFLKQLPIRVIRESRPEGF